MIKVDPRSIKLAYPNNPSNKHSVEALFVILVLEFRAVRRTSGFTVNSEVEEPIRDLLCGRALSEDRGVVVESTLRRDYRSLTAKRGYNTGCRCCPAGGAVG